MNKKLIIFNWKMAPQSLGEAKRLLTYNLQLTTNNKNIEIVICPPFVYLLEASSVVGRRSLVKLGAQNVFWEEKGPYTGEISVKMLKNFGVEYVLIGHSECRKYLNETDEMINKKVLSVLKAGLKVVLCVGEDLSVRRRGKKAVENYIKKQLEKDLKGVLNLKSKILNLIIAYEPIWAINTGHSDTPRDALEIIKFIKKILVASGYALTPKVLYGGSVDSKNIAKFLEHSEIDGALVGHASLKAGEIKKIIQKYRY
ncbi:triose-phosphate isomerase [Candidatus Wolfebacteria bacterium]|nr:triose-phosphate isomerase [Candidatus Wolfebacteria bacterium]